MTAPSQPVSAPNEATAFLADIGIDSAADLCQMPKDPLATYQDVVDGEVPYELEGFDRWAALSPETGQPVLPIIGRFGEPPPPGFRSTYRYKDANSARPSGGEICFIATGTLPADSDYDAGFVLLIEQRASCDRVTGRVSPWAIENIKRCKNSYTEVSSDGTALLTVVKVKELAKLPKQVRTKTIVNQPPLPGVTEQPAVIVHGLGPASFVAMTGRRLSDCSEDIETIESIEWLVEENQMREPPGAASKLAHLTGWGDAPGRMRFHVDDEVTTGRWKDRKVWDRGRSVDVYSSEAEAFRVVAQQVLTEAKGHGQIALGFIRDNTPWGRGEIADSPDPGRFGRESYIVEVLLQCSAEPPPPPPPPSPPFQVDPVAIEKEMRVLMIGALKVPPFQPEDARRLRALQDPRKTLQEALSGLAAPNIPERLAAPITPEQPIGDALVDFAARYAAVQAQADDGVLVPGLLGRGRITNVAAGPKTGKSTLLIAALVGFSLPTPRQFPGFGAPTKQSHVLYLSEQHGDDDAVLVDAFGGAASTMHGIDRRSIPPAAMKSWTAFVTWLAKVVKHGGYDIVVLDSFEAWVPDLEDGNSSAQIAQRYGELSRVIAQACNVAVICVLHTKKEAGPTLDFDAMLGSTKFRASSDFNVMLARVAPDDPSDTRVVLRREGRDPFGLIRNVCGRLPDSVAAAIRDRAPAGPARLCYQLRGEIVQDAEGRERASMHYELVDVPPEWQASTAPTPAKVQKADARQFDDDVLLAAVRLHAAEVGPKPVGVRKLAKEGFVDRAAARMPGLPSGYDRPGETRVRSAEARLIEARLLVAHDGGGVTLGAGNPVFPPVKGEVSR